MNKAVQQFEKDFVKTKHINIVDSLTTAMVNLKGSLDLMVQDISEKVDII
jgi:hypothetical protein